MCSYVYEEHQGLECNEKYDPRHHEMYDFGGTKRSHHGGVQTIRGLAMSWAESLDYDERICRVWNDGV